MQRIVSGFLILGFCLVNASALDIDRILSHIDQYRQFSETYSSTVKMASFQPGTEPQVVSMRTYSRDARSTLVVYDSPSRDAGKKMLLLDGKIWMYFPRAGQTIVIQPSGTLFGSVAMGDILSPPVSDIYEFTDWEQTEVEGEERAILRFKARDRRAPYGEVTYHYTESEGRGRMVYSECRARSGILLKRAYFSNFLTNPQGWEYATRIKYESAVDPDYYVLMQLSDLKPYSALPDSYFLPEGLRYAQP